MQPRELFSVSLANIVSQDCVLFETHSGKRISFKTGFGDLAIKFLKDTKLSEPPNASSAFWDDTLKGSTPLELNCEE
ncbi:hypothetical protein BpHYR1_018067 [Brachionus plicatilis]|uniref:Uncharacterized protein n=1 Tax=Brachionus plicatilis TaxID=10195 RepID=A0A3M7S6W7_BRAPC|nr:hypothetical protein BpHYR1_018067 [Brachionus plicatilis]